MHVIIICLSFFCAVIPSESKEQPTQLTPKPLSLHSNYIWEKIDPKHRTGLAVQQARDKYEKKLLKNPHWEWREKFWEWLDSTDKGRRIPQVHFYSPEERERLRLRIEGGKLIATPGEKMFVVGLDQQIYIASKSRGSAKTPAYTHGSFFACEPILAAGKITIAQDGTITQITNHSGHYKPGAQETAYFLELLEKAGIDLSNIPLDLKLSGVSKALRKFPDARAWLHSYRSRV